MNTLILDRFMRNIQRVTNKYSPEILSGIGIAGMITTTILAVKATPKALRLLEEAEKRYLDSSTSKASKGELVDSKGKEIPIFKPLEKVKIVYTCYIPSVVIGFLSIFCLVGASSVNLRRNAALATAYTLSESALREYQEKVIETIGSKKEQAIKDDIAKDRIDKNPVTSREIIITEKGNTLCYDVISGRYFKSDMDKIKKAENQLNLQLRYDMFISLNEFYDEIGLHPTSLGDQLGWTIDDGYIELKFSSALTDSGSPCLVIDYRVAPRYDYKNG